MKLKSCKALGGSSSEKMQPSNNVNLKSNMSSELEKNNPN